MDQLIEEIKKLTQQVFPNNPEILNLTPVEQVQAITAIKMLQNGCKNKLITVIKHVEMPLSFLLLTNPQMSKNFI